MLSENTEQLTLKETKRYKDGTNTKLISYHIILWMKNIY